MKWKSWWRVFRDGDLEEWMKGAKWRVQTGILCLVFVLRFVCLYHRREQKPNPPFSESRLPPSFGLPEEYPPRLNGTASAGTALVPTWAVKRSFLYHAHLLKLHGASAYNDFLLFVCLAIPGFVTCGAISCTYLSVILLVIAYLLNVYLLSFFIHTILWEKSEMGMSKDLESHCFVLNAGSAPTGCIRLDASLTCLKF